MKAIDFVIASAGVQHVSRYAVESLENALRGIGMRGRRTPMTGTTVRRVIRYLSRAGIARAYLQVSQKAILVPMMGLQEHFLFPWAHYMEVVPVIFDCMPNEFADWVRLFKQNRVRTAFFTASQAAEHFKVALPGGNWLWLPEAIEIEQYAGAVPWEQRETDVLEFGRRYGRYHETIVKGLADSALRHDFERVRGQLLFPGKPEFVHGLAHSKISVCFPQSMTHPERFGDIETMTQRYLESMASGCVLVGHAPAELANLFGYNPVVDVDWAQPVEQLQRIISHPEAHAAMRKRNIESVMNLGSWNGRAHEVVEQLRDHGFGVPQLNPVVAVAR